MVDIDYEKIAEEAIDNIRKDREKADFLLSDLLTWSKNGPDRHSQVANSLAKYLETLQRSNEQLVKVATTAQKQNQGSLELSDEERDALFEENQEAADKKKKK